MYLIHLYEDEGYFIYFSIQNIDFNIMASYLNAVFFFFVILLCVCSAA